MCVNLRYPIRDKSCMSDKIRVAILDDHTSIIDGYLYRLSLKNETQIKVVATMGCGEQLEPTLAGCPVDVLLLDISVPTSPANPNPYPILYTIPKLLEIYPDLSILVITMYNERRLIRAVMDSGASGYLLKDDQTMIRDLANVIQSVASGGIVLSSAAYELLLRGDSDAGNEQLTERQLEVISLCASYPDWKTSDLAKKISVSNSTIRNLLSSAYLRLGVHTRLAAVSKAREMGIITPFSPQPTSHY